MKDQSEEFYAECLKVLKGTKIPFMVGGAFAINAYTGIDRETKDFDVFCKAGDYPKILHEFAQKGYRTQVTDERWLVKVIKGKFVLDIIFNPAIAITPVTDEWFLGSETAKFFGVEVRLLPPAELFWSKAFVASRVKYHGNDIAHLILIKHKQINWKRLLSYMDQYWEVLLIHLLNFRFIYPSEREAIPRWLLDQLLGRLSDQLALPTPKEKVCRGRLYSIKDFEIDVTAWGFTDIIGWAYDERKY